MLRVAGSSLIPSVLAGCLAVGAPAAQGSADHAGATGTAAARWRALPDAPEGRSEVVAAVQGRTVLVVGGFRADGTSSSRVDAWDAAARRWRRAPDLPIGVNHAMAASDGRRVYVVGGYAPGPGQRGLRRLSRRAFALAAGSRSWRELPPLPRARGAGGAAVVDGRLWVVGGVQRGRPRLARDAYVLDPRSGPWHAAPGPPTPREHLGVAAIRGRLYVLGGRVHGYDSNLGAAEVREPSGRWRRLPALPAPCGGCSASAVPGRIVLVGGESPRGVHAAVQAYDVARRRWTRLPPVARAAPRPRAGGRRRARAGPARWAPTRPDGELHRARAGAMTELRHDEDPMGDGEALAARRWSPMPEHPEADTRLLFSIAVLTLPEDGPDADRAPRRPAAERLRERLGPDLHARLFGR